MISGAAPSMSAKTAFLARVCRHYGDSGETNRTGSKGVSGCRTYKNKRTCSECGCNAKNGGWGVIEERRSRGGSMSFL